MTQQTGHRTCCQLHCWHLLHLEIGGITSIQAPVESEKQNQV